MSLSRGDLLILREREWRPGSGSILATILAVGATHYSDGDWWTATKVEVVTWQAEPEVRFIEVRTASIEQARRRSYGRASVAQ